MAFAECLGPSNPQSLLVAAESFSSSADRKRSSSYSNQDLDQRELHRATLPGFGARAATFYLKS